MLNAVVRAANTHTGPAMHTHTSTSRPLWVKRSRGGDLILVSCSFWLCAAHLNHWPKNHSWSTFFFFFSPLPWALAGVRQSTGATLQNAACVMKGMGGEASERAGMGWGEETEWMGLAGEERGVCFLKQQRDTWSSCQDIYTKEIYREAERERGREGERETEH